MEPQNNQDDVVTFDINRYPPFEDLSTSLNKRPYGVVKLKNIPYGVTAQEIRHFVGRVSSNKLIDDHTYGFPIHIIIERPTAKTLDCFLEFMTQQHAISCVSRAEQAYNRGKPPKIGQRHVHVVLSSQGELMSNLFPRANNVQWDDATGNPYVLPNYDPYSEGFRGFFTIEEMSSIVKHAETPQRSPFSARCMQRTYENMISTLYKFPWQFTQYYTVAARNYLYTTYMSQLDVLTAKVAPPESALVIYNTDIKLGGTYGGEREVGLSQILLKDFLGAGLNTPAFSMRQKHEICACAGQVGRLGLPLLAAIWPFEILSAPLGSPLPDDVLKSWVDILNKGFDAMVANGLSTGYEHLINISRHTHGHLRLEFTQQAQALHFDEATEYEYAVMEQIIEKGRVKWCLEHRVSYEPLESIKADVQVASQLAGVMQNVGLGSTGYSTHHFGFQTPMSVDRLVVQSSSDDPYDPTGPTSGHVLEGRTIVQHGLLTPSASRGPHQPVSFTSQNRHSNAHNAQGFQHAAYAIDPTTPEFIPSSQRASRCEPLSTADGVSSRKSQQSSADSITFPAAASVFHQAQVSDQGHPALPAVAKQMFSTGETGHNCPSQPHSDDQIFSSPLDLGRTQSTHRRSVTMTTPEHLRSTLRTIPRSIFATPSDNSGFSLGTSRTRRKTIAIHSPIDEEHQDHALHDDHGETSGAAITPTSDYLAEEGGVQIRPTSRMDSMSRGHDCDHDHPSDNEEKDNNDDDRNDNHDSASVSFSPSRKAYSANHDTCGNDRDEY